MTTRLSSAASGRNRQIGIVQNIELPDLIYSGAPRCPKCGGRASLSEQAASRLVDAGLGQLALFHCPESAGWHVWAPNAERPHPRLV
ncbi:MAG TPA: hypothetical protein VHX38_37305 [Pseudonocardiaceae bacterium]|jgi:hypothetical protein|nr:hypothetical protein [Pseudonocardiaceae bacterium]